MNKEEILVVIPFLASGAQGRELTLAVTGWRTHFKTPYHIVVVGDAHPITETGDDISFLPCPRIEWDADDIDNYIPHIDHVHKFREVQRAFPNTRGCIYACDDMYALKDFDFGTVEYPKIVAKDMGGNIHHPNGWIRDMAKTHTLCIREGLPVLNYVCHLPVWYEWDKLFAVYDKYNMDKQSYIVENIYYNLYHDSRTPIMIDGTDKIRCWIKNRKDDVVKYQNGFMGCVWCCNTPNGWSVELENEVAKHYGI